MRPVITSRRAFGRVFALGVAACVLVGSAAFAGPEQYKAHGVVKSFGPKRAYVNIAHEKIAGYMEAMTMSFEPRRAEQIDGLEVGAKVAFTFTVTDDGHRLIDAISKE